MKTTSKQIIVVWSIENNFTEPITRAFSLADYDVAMAQYASLKGDKKMGRLKDCGFYRRTVQFDRADAR